MPMTAMSASIRSSFVQEDRPDLEGLLEVAAALPGDPLVLVGLQHVQGGQRPAAAGVGQVGGQRVQPVVAGSRGDGVLVARPGDPAQRVSRVATRWRREASLM